MLKLVKVVIVRRRRLFAVTLSCFLSAKPLTPPPPQMCSAQISPSNISHYSFNGFDQRELRPRNDLFLMMTVQPAQYINELCANLITSHRLAVYGACTQ